MKRVSKRVISLFMSLLMLTMLIPTAALAAGTFSASAANVEAEATEGATVDVPIKLTENAGLTSLVMRITFDNTSLKLVGFSGENEIIPGNNSSPKFDAANKKGNYKLSWANDLMEDNITKTGTLITLHFEVLNGAVAGKKVLTITEGSAMDCSVTKHVVSATNGSITLLAAPITSVSFSLADPVKGAALPSLTALGSGYTGAVEWYEGNTATGSAATGNAKPNQVYTAKVTLTADTSAGESFAKPVTVPTGYTTVSNDGTKLVLAKTFKATAVKALTGITIGSAPTKTEYTVGEKFEKAGMTIKATYDDGTGAIVTDTSKFTVTPAGALAMTDTKVTVSYTEGGVTKTAEQIITVKAKALTDAMVSLDKGAYAYTGSQIKPTVTVKDGATTLKKDTDYTVAYGANNTVGTKVGTVTITGKGNYSGIIEKKFDITAKALTKDMVTLDKGTHVYDGTAQKVAAVTVKDGSTTLTEGTGYKVTYKNNTNAGTATVTISGQGNYAGEVQDTFTIAPKAVTLSASAISGTYTYSGQEQTAAAAENLTFTTTGTVGSYALKKGTDYTVEKSTADNTNAGAAALVIKPVDGSNYTFTQQIVSFNIGKAKITAYDPGAQTVVKGSAPTELSVTAEGVNGEKVPGKVNWYSDSSCTTAIANTEFDKTGTPYDVSGYYAFTLDASAKNYELTGGKITGAVTFHVVDIVFSFKGNSVAVGNGVTVNPATYGTTWDKIVKIDSGIKADVNGTAATGTYKLDVTGTPAAGNQTYKVLFNGTAGSKTYTDVVVFEGTAKVDAKSVAGLTVTITGEPTYTGTPVTPATVTVKDGITTLTETTDYTLSYSINTNAGTATVTVKGQGNYTGSKDVTFTIAPKELTDAMIGAITAVTYDGAPKTPALSVTDGSFALDPTKDYTAKYTSNTNAGTATVTITGKGNYKGTASKTFTINQKEVTRPTANSTTFTYTGTTQTYQPTGYDAAYMTISGNTATNAGTVTVTVRLKDTQNCKWAGGAADPTFSFTIAPKNISGAAVSVSGTFTYDGTAKTPAPTVADGGRALRSGTDYTVTHADNTEAGTAAKVIITGKGNYTGTANGTFTINKRSLAFTATVASKIYDGNGIADASNFALVGVVGTDNVSVNAAGITAVFQDNSGKFDAGRYSVKVSGAALTGADAANYVLSSTEISVSNVEIQKLAADILPTGTTLKKGDAAKADAETAVGGLSAAAQEALKIKDLADNEKKLEAVKKAMAGKAGQSETNSQLLILSGTTGELTLAYPDKVTSRFALKVTHLKSDGTIEVLTGVEVLAAGAKLTASEAGLYLLSWKAPSSGGSGSGSSSYGSGAHTFTTDLTGINLVKVDNKVVPSKYYTISGSDVTLSAEFMSTLSNGKHTIAIENATKVARATFTVSSNDKATYQPTSKEPTQAPGEIVKVTVDSGKATVTAVYVDGVKLSGKDYVLSGKTVKLQGTYTQKLSVGYHTLQVDYSNGATATARFEIKGAVVSPKTGDASVYLYAAMALMSGTGAAYVTLRRKKEN